MTIYKFPSIDQFRNCAKAVQAKVQWRSLDENGDNVFDRTAKMPTLTFRGTTKAHGSNGGIIYDIASSTLQYQSRERVLELTSDNAGFMLYMMSKEAALFSIFTHIHALSDVVYPEKIAIYGEWCGGSIQKGVSINGLAKMFIIFGIKVIKGETHTWMDMAAVGNIAEPEHNIYNILDFGSYHIDIDFENSGRAVNEMIAITDAVEVECPIGKHFGRVLGTDVTVGEGVVWKCITPGYESSDFMFKIKGTAHANSKVKTLALVDVDSINERIILANGVTPAWRLDQGIEAACNLLNGGNMEMTHLGAYLKFVNQDIMKECSDLFVKSGISPKEVFPHVAKIARTYFIDRMNS